jgi:pyruvate dehydrogenase E1 component alpha subunit
LSAIDTTQRSQHAQLALAFYRQLYLLRHFDAAAAAAYGRKEIHGTYRGSMGQEAIPVGVCQALDERDVIYLSLRGISELLARGSDPGPIMAELFGKATGLSGGKGGALHMADASRGIMGIYGVLTAPVPLATGSALAARIKGTGAVTVCFFGDRATNEGVFHESLNMAALWQLPVLYVGINNAPEDADTWLGEHTAARSMAALAAVHGIRADSIDGTDVFNVYQHARDAVEQMRGGGGPVFLECQCFPLDEPSRAETEQMLEEMRKTGRYMGLLMAKKSLIGKKELTPPQHWQDGDPLRKLERRILDEGLADDAALATIRAEVEARVAAAVEFARTSEAPPPETALRGLYATPLGDG